MCAGQRAGVSPVAVTKARLEPAELRGSLGSTIEERRDIADTPAFRVKKDAHTSAEFR
jgi:hypothetical protein